MTGWVRAVMVLRPNKRRALWSVEAGPDIRGEMPVERPQTEESRCLMDVGCEGVSLWIEN